MEEIIFSKKYTISVATARFMDININTKMSFTECWIFILNYIDKHNLLSKASKDRITPDENLRKLLQYKPEKDGPLYHLTLHNLLVQCFRKIE